MSFNRKALIEAIDAIRESRGLSWRDVAEQTGVAASTFTRLSDGKTLTLENLGKIRAWAKINVDRFFEGEKDG